jgi:hypothetical protein
VGLFRKYPPKDAILLDYEGAPVSMVALPEGCP